MPCNAYNHHVLTKMDVVATCIYDERPAAKPAEYRFLRWQFVSRSLGELSSKWSPLSTNLSISLGILKFIV